MIFVIHLISTHFQQQQNLLILLLLLFIPKVDFMMHSLDATGILHSFFLMKQPDLTSFVR